MLRSWAGLCDISPDYSPILGPTEVEGFHVSTGWGTYGFKAAPDRRQDARRARRHRPDARPHRALPARALLRGPARLRAGRRGRESLGRQSEESEMKSSLEIAQEAELLPIETIAERIGLEPNEIEPYGRYKGKVPLSALDRLAGRPGRQARVRRRRDARRRPARARRRPRCRSPRASAPSASSPVLCLREPSLGPVFGIKGGAAGGGLAQVVPMEDLNLHFTGDIHAIGAANNLLAAMLDASILHGNPHKIDALRIAWRRAVDMNDRALRQHRGRPGRPAQRLPARDRLRHHRRLRGHGDPRRVARPPRPAPRGWARSPSRAPTTAASRSPPRTWRRRRDDRAAQGGDQAEPDPDARGPAVPDARRALREHRPRQLVAHRRPDRASSSATTS